jgi:hypothetical protein
MLILQALTTSRLGMAALAGLAVVAFKKCLPLGPVRWVLHTGSVSVVWMGSTA